MKRRVLIITLLITVAAVTAWSLDATITDVRGKVEIRESSGAPWVAVSVGDTVPVGATISTSFNAGAEIQVGESTVTVEQLTRMRIDELVSESGTDRSDINLRVGRINADVRGSGNNRAEFRVRSPIATASVRGTNFSFDGANLFVAEGIVILANRFNEAVAVAGGEQSSAAGDGAPQKPDESAESASTVTVSVGPVDSTPVVQKSTTGSLTIEWRIVE